MAKLASYSWRSGSGVLKTQIVKNVKVLENKCYSAWAKQPPDPGLRWESREKGNKLKYIKDDLTSWKYFLFGSLFSSISAFQKLLNFNSLSGSCLFSLEISPSRCLLVDAPSATQEVRNKKTQPSDRDSKSWGKVPCHAFMEINSSRPQELLIISFFCLPFPTGS